LKLSRQIRVFCGACGKMHHITGRVGGWWGAGRKNIFLKNEKQHCNQWVQSNHKENGPKSTLAACKTGSYTEQ